MACGQMRHGIRFASSHTAHSISNAIQNVYVRCRNSSIAYTNSYFAFGRIEHILRVCRWQMFHSHRIIQIFLHLCRAARRVVCGRRA